MPCFLWPSIFDCIYIKKTINCDNIFVEKSHFGEHLPWISWPYSKSHSRILLEKFRDIAFNIAIATKISTKMEENIQQLPIWAFCRRNYFTKSDLSPGFIYIYFLFDTSQLRFIIIWTEIISMCKSKQINPELSRSKA